MLFREFTEINELKDVDLLDDLHFFMHNDSRFYRKALFPLIQNLKNSIEKGQKCKDTMFRSCVDSAAKIYCKKFNIPDHDKSVFTDVDRDELARKIFNQESDRVKQDLNNQENKENG